MEFYTKVAGVTFNNEGENTQNRQRIIAELARKGSLKDGTELTLRRDPFNRYDTNAVAVLAPDGRQLGFLPREIAAKVSYNMMHGFYYKAYVSSVTGGNADSVYGINLRIRYGVCQENSLQTLSPKNLETNASLSRSNQDIKRFNETRMRGHMSMPSYNEAPSSSQIECLPLTSVTIPQQNTLGIKDCSKEISAITISLASPEQIRIWSYGEVKYPDTIDRRTLKPVPGGLFCERIFGPTKDWECNCGKYKKIRYKGKICDRCGVEITRSKVRRERMGHIELAAPVSHIWYLKGIPSPIGLLLDISPMILEKVLYFSSYIVVDPGHTPLSKNQLLSEKEYQDMWKKYGGKFDADIGAEAVKKLLQQIDLEELSKQLRAELKDASGQKKARIVKRLEVVDAFRVSGNKPEWMIIDVLPVIPPEIRPMVPLDGGRYASSDLNDLYRRVINRNNRLKRLIQLNAPDIIVRNEKRMLQEAVDALIDNGRRGRAVTGANNRALKSLSDMLKGKQGRFRQNLLGKRVDYSGRSVIVVGPSLKIYQCGLPKEMAIELFRPFVMKKLVDDGSANNIKAAKKMVEKGEPAVWDALEFVIKEHPVMLNRAPTLHRLGIQAFEPVLVEGRAIKLHPLVCTAFNADFDGDQMAVHVPLSAEAQTEARILMLSANNLLRPQDGGPVTIPTQDMILGAYYLTFEREEEGSGHCFADRDEAMLAYDAGVVTLHSPIKVRLSKEVDGVTKYKLVSTTVGRLIYNEAIPQDLGFVDRSDPEQMFEPEINFVVGKKQLGKIIDRCISKHGFTVAAGVLDAIKDLGYHYSTIGSLTVAIADMTVPQKKYELIAQTEKEIVKIDRQYRRGLITNDERYRLSVEAWDDTTKDVTTALQESMDRYNPIFMMADSGARGSMAQIRQLAGIRGLMADTSGRTIEIPIKSNFREGLSVLEYFISSRGARKGMADTALRTADSGYLTRRLVDVSQEVIIREDDCGTDDGIVVSEIEEHGQVIETFAERIQGRFPTADIKDPTTGEVLFTKDTMLRKDDAEKLESHGIHAVKIRSVLTCRARSGVCAKCYGINLAIGEPVGAGEAVGIIAAQSIGEPGTQLTMRTFHTGGVAGGDITQGLPRVEELFEARKPKKMAQLAEIGGRISIEETKRNVMCNVTITADDGEVVTYALPYASGIRVKDGDVVEKGYQLTEGVLYPQDVLRLRGLTACYDYLISEIQKPYRQEGININDHHIEIVIRQMMRKVWVMDSGDSNLISGSTVDLIEFWNARESVLARIYAGETNDMGKDLRLPTCIRLLRGITHSALTSNSWISAAATAEETSNVLLWAAIRHQMDGLHGIKENVIVGNVIPAGTGLAQNQATTNSK